VRDDGDENVTDAGFAQRSADADEIFPLRRAFAASRF
jgi:hypothetical protein